MPAPDRSSSPTTNTCACYISDDGYLFPSLMSAIQLKQNMTSGKADIVMFHIGRSTQTTAFFRDLYQKLGFLFYVVSPDVIENKHIMFARLFIDRFAPAEYDRFLYIDGDTQIASNMDRLIDVSLPAGHFSGARDPMSLAIDLDNRESQAHRIYFEKIGMPLERVRSYFNSGVLRFDRQSWTDISQRALRAVQSQQMDFRFPDQDALNLVAGEMCLPMSFRWNFPAFLLGTDIEDLVTPALYHFMSNPRPWQGAFWPWGHKWHATYVRLVAEYPELKPYMPTLSLPRRSKYLLQQSLKRYTEPAFWGGPKIVERISAVEASAFV
jgi:lipopolysaccharide biosynthesis glycosyltransferase